MRKYLFATLLAACVGNDPRTVSREDFVRPQPPGSVSLNASTGEFFYDGHLIGTVTCSDYTDPRINGTDLEFNQYLEEKCTDVMTPEPTWRSDPCDAANATFSTDAGGYTIDTCRATTEAAGDPYWGGVAVWHRVPDWSTEYDAECYVETATGTGCCNFYRDIDPAELSECDSVYPQPLALADSSDGSGSGSGSGGYEQPPTGGSGSGIARTATTTAMAGSGAPPGPDEPRPPPDRDRMMNRLGAILIAIGGLLSPASPEAGKVIRDLGSRIVKEIENRQDENRKMQQRRPRGGGVGAPPDPPLPPGTERDLYQRGGRKGPPDPRPARPPEVLPPGGRPITKPGQITPQPRPRPPFRPPGR